MNKTEFVNAIHEQLVAKDFAVSKKLTNEFLDAALETIKNTVAEGDKVSLTGFGSFELRERNERQGRNPQTGEVITIPARKVPGFKAGKTFKEAVK